MFFRKSVPALLALAASMQLVAGCGGLVMDRKEIDATGRIALVSVVVPRVADISKDENRVVLQAAANHARGRVLAGLAAVHGWTVLDPMKERMGKTVQAFGTVAVADLEALFPAAGERKRIAKLFKEERSRWKEEFLAAEDMPVIPREAFAP